MNGARISFFTFGCRLNKAETAILQRSVEEQDFLVVNIEEPADVVVVNTCTVTENGDTDTRKLVNKINRLYPETKIALIGCQAQIQRERLLEMTNVHWVVGNSRKMELAKILKETYEIDSQQVITPVISRESFRMSSGGVDRQHTRANLKIQDGCDFFCSFCVIPFARGRARSRVFGDLLDEAKNLILEGHREIVLTGINLGSYRFKNKNIVDVVSGLEKLAGLERLRISSIEPTTIPFDLLELMTDSPKICRYLHIPLQTGSDRLLKAMNRRYHVKEFANFIDYVYQKIPEICIGTDVIVGFPGETDQHFNETYDFLNSLPVAYFHVFRYSERPLTRSRKYDGKVTENVRKERSQILRILGAEKRRKYMKDQIDTIQMVLFEKKKNGYWTGLTDTYIRVMVNSPTNLHNQLVPVHLDEIDKNVMRGKLS
jgi:threonylcarbamoyladenosine tRNA methylthiotransferase MtaB